MSMRKKRNAKAIKKYAETQVTMLRKHNIQFSFSPKQRERDIHPEQHKHVSKGKS